MLMSALLWIAGLFGLVLVLYVLLSRLAILLIWLVRYAAGHFR